jgi:serine/threonine protein kinase
MPLRTGARLGPYEVTSAIGAGGMGEVYRARDTKLHRDVAIKVLPELFAGSFKICNSAAAPDGSLGTSARRTRNPSAIDALADESRNRRKRIRPRARRRRRR